jgi:hypothetical protein
VALGDLAAFSVATIDRGRLRGRSEACEVGRLCQLKGEFLDGIALDGKAFIGDTRLRDGSAESRSFSIIGEWFSFVGDIELARGSIASRVVSHRGLGLF